MIYDINGIELSNGYDINAAEVQTGFDINGNEVQVGSVPLSERRDIIFSQGNRIVRRSNNFLFLSEDGGVTFPKSLDVSIVGTIRNIYVFTDGTLNVFGHASAYYSDDWKSLKPSTVLDENGNEYQYSQYDTFTANRHSTNPMFVDGVEMYVFGNYALTNELQMKKNVWYTTDKGKTYKVAYAFGTSTVRHIHYVYQNASDGSFWITTGDNNSQSMVISGTYSVQNDSWSWETKGTGGDYKWAGMEIYNDYIYYCLDHTPGKVLKCKTADVSDLSKHEIILDGLPNDCINILIDTDTGEMLVGLSIYGGTGATCRTLYYSSDGGETWGTVNNAAPSYYPYYDTIYYGWCGINADKKILSGLWSDASGQLLTWEKIPSVWLDDLIREKFPYAFQRHNDSE